MRLYPPVSEQEALEWLLQQAVAQWGAERRDEMTQMLKPIAEAMAAVSGVELPEEVEPQWP
jgi:hypothetical protein